MRVVAVALAIGVVLSAAACRQDNAAEQNIGAPTPEERPDKVRAPALGFAELPARWTLGHRSLIVRVAYRDAPQGAGLMVYIRRDLPLEQMRRLPGSGGGLTERPIPIEGSGVAELRFDGIAYSAPADAPESFPVRTGRHIFKAELLNHTRLAIGLVIRHPSDRTLAEARSEPIMIEGED